jgi:hypothetical protein
LPTDTRHTASWFPQIARVEIERFETRKEALAAEAAAIRDERPRFNKAIGHVPGALRTHIFTMRMDPEMRRDAKLVAAADRRSLSSLIEILLIRYCQDRGLLTEEGRLPKRGRR